MVKSGYRKRIDAHTTHGLSYLKLGLRWLQAVVLQNWPILALAPLLPGRQQTAMASQKQQLRWETVIEFSHLNFPKPAVSPA